MEFLQRVQGGTQGRIEVRCRLGQETSLAPPCSKLRSFGSKCAVLTKKTHTTVGIFRRSPVIRRPGYCWPLVLSLFWHFATKCAAVKFEEPWMSNHLPELRDHSYVRSAMYPKFSTKKWRDKSCWLNPRESGPVVVQGQGGVAASPTLLGPALM